MKQTLLGLLLIVTPLATRAGSIDVEAATNVFAAAHAACSKDNGALWGVSLCGPILIADPATRDAVASESDGAGVLSESDGVFVGVLPKDVGIANHALDWAGRKWTMAMWPLPERKDIRTQLLMHESWHRIQAVIGFPQTSPTNAHLDSLEGRTWLRREWRALKKALESEGNERRSAVMHAILFREHRREILPGSEHSERSLEMHEGLAEYTGVALSAQDSATAAARAIEMIDQYDGIGGFVRTFAYASGPAYGVLLDLAGSDWRTGLDSEDDFTGLILQSYQLDLPTSIATWARRMQRNYSDSEMQDEESAKAKQKGLEQAAFRAKFLDERVLILPFESMQMEFDPNRVKPLDPFGTVYETIVLRDTWGRLTVRSGGILLDKSFSNARLPLPSGAGQDVRETNEWTLELNEGWSITDSEARPPHWVVAKKVVTR